MFPVYFWLLKTTQKHHSRKKIICFTLFEKDVLDSKDNEILKIYKLLALGTFSR